MEQLLEDLHDLRLRVERHWADTGDGLAEILKADLADMEREYARISMMMSARAGNPDRAVAGEIEAR